MRILVLVVSGAVLSAGGLACSSDSGTKSATPGAPAVASAIENPLTRRGGPLRQQWAMDRLWEDGKAEVATYEAERMVQGESRRFEHVFITAKEEFNQQYNVRTDSLQRKDIFPVMRFGQLCSIPTDTYPYHLQTCLFFRRDQPVQLHKLTTSAQEWGGTTFKVITDDGMQYVQAYNSYQDGQGAGERQLRRTVLFEDALPYTLRSLRFEQLPHFQTDMYELQQTNQATPPVLYHAQVRTEDALTADTPEPAWRVRVALTNQKQNVYWFSKKYPHVLLRQTTWDGRTLRLKQVQRITHLPGSSTGRVASGAAGE
ncbi:hypothetical protein HNQ93_002152 [Hymenobacter luteus]|uniref:DUF3108 domain-containing protein n=2 Tax=Hymenobacter TaxID=89966 RepID=A0A7W9T0F8_9BACT|nr:MULTISPECIES: hypothetical protein [Hymenobacter]MBB4602279.1 hypothetical protein [Hymenobacter latericoloratus]MBB6059292.1 hypothetical protein [Hymenobacter luteus]